MEENGGGWIVLTGKRESSERRGREEASWWLCVAENAVRIFVHGRGTG